MFLESVEVFVCFERVCEKFTGERYPLNVRELSWGRQLGNGNTGNRDVKVSGRLDISWDC